MFIWCSSCTYVCEPYHMHVWSCMPTDTRRGNQIPWNWSYMIVNSYVGTGNRTQALKEQPVLLITGAISPAPNLFWMVSKSLKYQLSMYSVYTDTERKGRKILITWINCWCQCNSCYDMLLNCLWLLNFKIQSSFKRHSFRDIWMCITYRQWGIIDSDLLHPLPAELFLTDSLLRKWHLQIDVCFRGRRILRHPWGDQLLVINSPTWCLV